MNLALSDEQVFLREAARGALSRFKTLEAAREALDGDESALPDLWPTAKEAGWPGLLIDEDHGGAGLDAFDAMLVLGECGRVLAGVPLLGHLPATAILGAAPNAAELLRRARQRRAARGLPAGAAPQRPRSSAGAATRASGLARARAAERRRAAGCGWPARRVTGSFAFVPDAPGADVLVGVALRDGKPVGVAIAGRRRRASAIEPTSATTRPARSGTSRSRTPPRVVLDAPERSLAAAWYLAQALIAAESLGSVETALDVSVAYAKERFTFGRAIGSYQAVKHALTEVLRQLENGRSLLYYAGWARNGAPGEFPLAASAARSVGGRALDDGRAHDDLRARRHRRHLGARRAAVLPPRAALAAAARRHRRRRPTASPAS